MRIYHLEDIGAHYVETLRHWRESFTNNLNEILPMGYGEEFLRMWHYYYCYCEGAFRERAIGDVQVLFIKPSSRREPFLAALWTTQRHDRRDTARRSAPGDKGRCD